MSQLHKIIAAIHARLEAARPGQFALAPSKLHIRLNSSASTFERGVCDPMHSVSTNMDGHYGNPQPVVFVHAPDYRGEAHRDYWHVSELGFDRCVAGCAARVLAAYPATVPA